MKKLPPHYDTIDMPVYLWNKVHETGDFTWLLIKKTNVSKPDLLLLINVWENIFSQYIEEFGWSENFIRIKKKEREIELIRCEKVITGDETLQTFIDIEQDELNDMKKMGVKCSIMDTKIAIESKFKFQINMQATSVKEFYSYLKHLK